MNILLVGLTALSIAAPVEPSSSAGVLRGVGATTCGEFANAYALDPKRFEDMYFSWAQGFISGANISSTAAGNEYRDQAGDLQGQAASLRRYCNEHPLANYADAVIALFRSLPLKTYKSP